VLAQEPHELDWACPTNIPMTKVCMNAYTFRCSCSMCGYLLLIAVRPPKAPWSTKSDRRETSSPKKCETRDEYYFLDLFCVLLGAASVSGATLRFG
jgi:hypothetical protein